MRTNSRKGYCTFKGWTKNNSDTLNKVYKTTVLKQCTS